MFGQARMLVPERCSERILALEGKVERLQNAMLMVQRTPTVLPKVHTLAPNTKADLTALQDVFEKRLDEHAVHTKAEIAALEESVGQKLDGQEAHTNAAFTALLRSFGQKLEERAARIQAEVAALQASLGQRLDTQQATIDIWTNRVQWVHKEGVKKFKRLENQIEGAQYCTRKVRDALNGKADIECVPSNEEMMSFQEQVLQSLMQTTEFSGQLFRSVMETKADANIVATLDQLAALDERVRRQIQTEMATAISATNASDNAIRNQLSDLWGQTETALAAATGAASAMENALKQELSDLGGAVTAIQSALKSPGVVASAPRRRRMVECFGFWQ